MKRRETAVLMQDSARIVNGKVIWQSVDSGEVRVMARAEGYAMVRFKGAMPFVVSEKALQPNVAGPGPAAGALGQDGKKES